MTNRQRQIRLTLQKARRDLLTAANGHANGVARMLIVLERDLLRLVANGGSKRVTREQINRITELIGRELLETMPELRSWMETGFKGAAGNGLTTQADIIKASLGVKKWGEIPIDRVRSTFETFAEGIAKGDLIRVSDPKVFAKYRAAWDKRWVGTMRDLQREFSRAAATGDSWTAVAKRIRGPLGTLDLPGRRMAPEHFARMYTRTMMTQVANNASTRTATAAGIDKFANLGVSDERQATICRGATAAGAMTLEEWDASEYGRAPRHPNCRCLLAAVPRLDEESLLIQEVGANG